MIQIRLKKRTPTGDDSLLKMSIAGGMNYPTFHKMASGNWNVRTMDLLGRFLTACGYTVDTLKDTKFGDIFMVSEENDGRR